MGVHVAIKVDGIVRWVLAFWLFIRRHRRSVLSAFPHELKSAVVGDRLSTGYPVKRHRGEPGHTRDTQYSTVQYSTVQYPV